MAHTGNGKGLIRAGLLIGLLSGTTGAQARTVAGLVLEEHGLANLFPASFVALTLNSQTGGRTAPVYTGRQGRFFFDNVEPGEYTLEIWTRGYKTGVPFTQEVVIPARERVELDTIIVDPEFSP